MNTAKEVAELALWLSAHEKAVVGLDVSYDGDNLVLAFAGRDEGDELEVVVDAAARPVVQAALGRNTGIQLIPWSLLDALTVLEEELGVPRDDLIGHLQGCAWSVLACLGTAIHGPHTRVGWAREYLRAWLAAEDTEMPPYYRAVAVPFARLMTVPASDAPQWRVSFSDLLLRVIAKLASEPQLTRAFLEEEYPPQAFLTRQLEAEYGEKATHEFAEACILYAALGGDLSWMKDMFPEEAARLDGVEREALGHQLDKYVPALRMWARQTYEDGRRDGFTSLYNRRTPYLPEEPEPGQYLDSIIANTVSEIIEVFVVSAANIGGRAMRIIDGPHRIIITGEYGQQDSYEFLATLRQIATLGSPLSPVPLGPVVALES